MDKRKSLIFILIYSIALALFCACGEEASAPTEEKGNVVATESFVKISLQSAEIEAGGRIALDAFVYPSDKKPEWSSSDPSVASVDDVGVVTAHGAGKATIAASLGEYEKSFCLVTVTATKNIAYNFYLARQSLKLYSGENYGMEYVLFAGDNRVTDADLVWNSSDWSVAGVTDEGVIIPEKYGKATISATYSSADGKYFTSECEVSVIEDRDVRIVGSDSVGEVFPGEKFLPEVEVYDGADKMTVNASELVYSSDNGEIIGYDGANFVARASGETMVRVAYRGAEATCRIRVKGVSAESFAVLCGNEATGVFTDENGYFVYRGGISSSNYAAIKGEEWRNLLAFAEENGYTRMTMKIYFVSGVCDVCPNGAYNALFAESGRDYITGSDCSYFAPLTGSADIAAVKDMPYFAIGMTGNGSFTFTISFE